MRRSRLLPSFLMPLVLSLSAAVARADGPAPDGACPVTDPPRAQWLADEFYAQGQYQHAAECYQVAGDLASANRAYVAALPGRSAETARRAADQAEQAKSLLRQVKNAFHAP